MTDTELVHLGVEGGIATITLDSPHNRNALSAQLVTELTERLAAAASDATCARRRPHSHRNDLLRGSRPFGGERRLDDRDRDDSARRSSAGSSTFRDLFLPASTATCEPVASD